METFTLMALPKEKASPPSKPHSPLSIILFIHKAMCNELDVLHRSTMGYPAAGRLVDIKAVFERCNLLKSIYENYLNAKDEVPTT